MNYLISFMGYIILGCILMPIIMLLIFTIQSIIPGPNLSSLIISSTLALSLVIIIATCIIIEAINKVNKE